MREIVDKLDFIKTENFCSVKDNGHKNEKTIHRLGENICNDISDQGRLLKIYEKNLKTQQ